VPRLAGIAYPSVHPLGRPHDAAGQRAVLRGCCRDCTVARFRVMTMRPISVTLGRMTPDIGLLNEKPLHASLKAWCAQPGDRFEVRVDGYVIDIVRDGLLLEIQTRSLASIKRKLTILVNSHKVRLVYPIAQEKWIVKPAQEADCFIRRKSPKTGRVEDLFTEMVSFPELLSNPNFSLEVLMIREEEVRRRDARRGWRRKGWVTEERRLLAVVERRLFEKPADWLALLPAQLDQFTPRDLADASGIRQELAQKMAYCLRKVHAIHQVGRRGRANVYSIEST
jgi:hypothetical protein